MKRRYFRGSLSERLQFYSEPGPGGCRLWTSTKNRDGYGTCTVDYKTVAVHRKAWEIANGRPVPRGMCVCHSCDVRHCIEPTHLWLGTSRENNDDKIRKRRHNAARGAAHYRAKLSDEQVAAIVLDPRRVAVIAEQYGVSQSQIYRIRSGDRWKSARSASPH